MQVSIHSTVVESSIQYTVSTCLFNLLKEVFKFEPFDLSMTEISKALLDRFETPLRKCQILVLTHFLTTEK